MSWDLIKPTSYDHVFCVVSIWSCFSSLLSKGNEKIVHRTINHILLDGPSLNLTTLS